jgi:hypothetical protein
MKETVLMFAIPDKGVRNDVRNIFASLKVQVKYVERPQYNRTLASLAGLQPMKDLPLPYDGPEFEEPLLIFAGFEDKKLGLIIDALKTYDKCKFPLKAVMTETSQNWAAAYAYIHIKAEHESLHPKG